MKAKHGTSAAEREAQVLAVLNSTLAPLGPSEISRRIAQPWCCDRYGASGFSAPITPVLRRVGAVRHPGGLYTKPLKAKP